jgi:type III secretory pathway component EscV
LREGNRSIRSAELGLALLVISVVAMMIVPLPTWLLDILIATNLSVSVAILFVVLYVPDALAIATFQTLRLVTTLFRLALNVSSVRPILLQANAGEVIRAFGTFVVRGNYVVGGVIFWGAEARPRRRQLSRESQFYGAMDGSLKFVKGNVRLRARHGATVASL